MTPLAYSPGLGGEGATITVDESFARDMATWGFRIAYTTVMVKWLVWSLALIVVCCVIFAIGGPWRIPAGILGVIIFVAMFVAQPIQNYSKMRRVWGKVVSDRTGWVAKYQESSFVVLPPFGGKAVIPYTSLRNIRTHGQLVRFEVLPSGNPVMVPLRLLPNADVAWLHNRAGWLAFRIAHRVAYVAGIDALSRPQRPRKRSVIFCIK